MELQSNEKMICNQQADHYKKKANFIIIRAKG